MNLKKKCQDFIKKTFLYSLWLYGRSYFRYVLLKGQSIFGKKSESPPEYDCVFVVADRGWILEKICLEIAKRFGGRYFVQYDMKSLVPAKAYFFSHYSLLPLGLKFYSRLWGSRNFALYTHPSHYRGVGDREYALALNQCRKVFCLCSIFERSLSAQGVNRKKLTSVLGAADPETFLPHSRSNGAVGFCSLFSPRKQPDVVFEIIKAMPHRKFILLGRSWDRYAGFAEMLLCPNFRYFDVPYSDYPKIYGEIDVFVSPSKLEGGPFPLVEAMMCNTVPVASRTGFAPDIIRDGENGFLFDTDSPVPAICGLIERAYTLKTDVRKTVEHLTWERFSSEIVKALS